MSDVVAPLGLGTVNGAGSTEALFLKVFAGEVVAAYELQAKLLSRIDMRSMPSGAKSVTIRQLGRAFTRRREIGKDLLSGDPAATNLTPSGPADTATFLSQINQGEREVFVDDPLLAAEFIDSFEEFKNDFDARGRLSKKMGEALSVDNDKLALNLVARGATLVDWTTGNSIPTEMQTALAANEVIDANALTDGSALLDAIRILSERWDALEVPEEGRALALRPAQYNLLVQNQDLLNRDFGGANGIFSDGTVYRAWNVELVKTNSMPRTNITYGAAGSTGVRNPIGYNGDFSNLAAVGWHRDAVVGVRAGVAAMQMEESVRNQGTLLVAKMATGFDIVQPQGIGAISIA
jgi:hypothetical protein